MSNPEQLAAAAALAALNDDEAKPAAIGETPTEVINARHVNIKNPTSSDSITKRGRKKKEDHKFPVEPRVIQIIKKPRTYVNHSYRDFSSVPAEMDYEAPTEISKMTFPEKVHHMLNEDKFAKCITWLPHGRAFIVRVPVGFENEISTLYFGHKRYSSFLRQLNNYSFRHISKGPDRNAYYHEFILRGLTHLTKYMPEPKDARRLISDPDNELDFYALSSKFPLPDDLDFNMVSPEETAKNPSGSVRPVPETPRIEMPAAKRARPTLVPNVADTFLSLATAGTDGHAPIAAPQATEMVAAVNSSNVTAPLGLTAATSASSKDLMSQLQGAVDSNNKMLAVAALRARLGGLRQQPQPLPVNNDAQVQALAALLQAYAASSRY
jgi:hypothetical protein